ncbi:hypothetical protein FA95DRAFT_307983 [Auriscalpium vulgare]|uniref:Uncharacterized protein n=1 Tax=Auriscalpium vulgare TaxID=40419 RepID=A0ACB8RIQ2_9AGAM|nr:hypothetical protein FA95DRAFT_307983 [Auriscalpium vulgare]
MADRDFLLTQTIITNIKPEQTFRVVVRHGSSLTPDLFETLLASSAGKCVAVAPAFGQHCRIVALAFATPIMALVVHLSVSHAKKKCSSLPTLLSTILSDKSVIKVVLRADRLAAGLHLDFSQPLRNAFDLFSLSAEAEQKLNAVPFLLSHIGIKRVDRHGLKGAFGNEKFERAEEVGTRAWLLSYLAAEQGPLVVSRGQKVDTAKLSPQFLRALSETVRSADQKYAMKPSVTKNDIKPNATYKDGKLRVQCDRYKSRLRPMTGQMLSRDLSLE